MRGQNTALTRRGLSVVPDSWHCSRNGQGRQWPMRAAYNTRKEPLRSSLRSCAKRGRPTGQSRVPSGCGGNTEPGKPWVKEGCAQFGGP